MKICERAGQYMRRFAGATLKSHIARQQKLGEDGLRGRPSLPEVASQNRVSTFAQTIRNLVSCC
jgi:hypothetical protein